MVTLKIKYPIWKTRSVGISLASIGNNGIDLEIMYENKEGKRIYPHIYHMSREKLTKYPMQHRRGVDLVIVPIQDFEIVQWREQ